MSALEEVFECTTDAVFGTDKHMRVRFWNKFCEELFDINKDSAIGKKCSELICGKDLLGNDFCGTECKIIKHHDRCSPNYNWDLVVKRNGGENVVVNVGSYYTGSLKDNNDTDIRVFHSMRTINCHQLIRRLALNTNTTADDNSNINRLSKREYEILRLVSSGIKIKNIAEQLGISHTTVRNHIKNIYAKLEVHSQAEAINCAMRHGLV